MSNDNQREELLEAIHHACRAFQNAADEVDEAVCLCVDINRTDLRCLDILERLGPLTAGELASKSGLTTGATTTLLDRLEHAGYATRTRDTVDRRKVLVDITPTVRGFAEEFYGRLAAEWDALAARFSNSDLATIVEFLEASRAINAGHAAQLRRDRAEAPPSSA